MTFHPRPSTLRSYEATSASPRLRRHLARCPECRARLGAARDVRNGLAALTETTPPAPLRRRIRMDFDAGEDVLLPTGDAPGAKRSPRVPLRAAALVLLGVAGGISGTVLAAPLLERLWQATVRTEAPAPATAPAAPVRVAGVAVPVPEGGLVVRVEDPAPALRVHVEITSGDLLEVEGRGPAADAVFRPAGSVLVVRQPGAGELWIGVPGVGRVRLEIDGREVLISDGAALHVPGASESGNGTEVRLRVPDREVPRP